MNDSRTDKRPSLPPWIGLDDLGQSVALARLEAEATGFDPEIAAEKTRDEFVRSERTRVRRETSATNVFHDKGDASAGVNAGLGWLSESNKVVGLSPPKRQTAGQRKKFVRNQVILAASLAGFSLRDLGTAFDLPHSRIQAIVEEMRRQTGRATG